MTGTCSTNGKNVHAAEFLSQKPKEREYLENLRVGDTIILKWTFRKQMWKCVLSLFTRI
jgi:hypothetical protein